MKFQLVLNMERSSDSQDMAEIARHCLEMVQMADAGGFEIVWAAEHHGVELYIAPNPFQILTWWAAHTSRIRLGTAVVVAAYWHPVKVAEESALLDLYSGGRLELGLGSGALQREFDRLRPGVTQSDGYRYAQEMLPAVKALWAGDYAHDGELWSFPTTTSVPKPVQQPHPPMWIAARSPVSFDFAVKNGCHVSSWAMSRPFSEVETYKQRFDDAVAGNPGIERPIFATMRYACVVERDSQLDDAVAATRQQMAVLGALRDPRTPMNNGFLHGIRVEDMAVGEEFSPESLKRNLLFGTPDQVIARLKQYQALDVDQFIYSASFGLDLAAQKRSLDLFIREVIPEFGSVQAGAERGSALAS